MMLNGKVHQRAPVASASTQTNTEIQQQIMRNTTTPMMIGVRFIFLLAGSAAMGAGLAGTLPAYSMGAGGGGTGVAGRCTDGTAVATRGETIVAPASIVVASKTNMICSPN